MRRVLLSIERMVSGEVGRGEELKRNLGFLNISILVVERGNHSRRVSDNDWLQRVRATYTFIQSDNLFQHARTI